MTLAATTLWYITRGSGVVALVLLTVSVALGVLTSLRVGAGRWPRFAVTSLHRNLTLLAIAFVAIHVVTTVTDGFAPIHLQDAMVPFLSPYRPIWLGLGTVAFDLLLAFVLTSYLRHRIGARMWRGVHWLAYVCWPVDSCPHSEPGATRAAASSSPSAPPRSRSSRWPSYLGSPLAAGSPRSPRRRARRRRRPSRDRRLVPDRSHVTAGLDGPARRPAPRWPACTRRRERRRDQGDRRPAAIVPVVRDRNDPAGAKRERRRALSIGLRLTGPSRRGAARAARNAERHRRLDVAERRVVRAGDDARRVSRQRHGTPGQRRPGDGCRRCGRPAPARAQLTLDQGSGNASAIVYGSTPGGENAG